MCHVVHHNLRMKRPSFFRPNARPDRVAKASAGWPAVAAFVLWACAAGVAVWWGLRGPVQPVVAAQLAPSAPAADPAVVARALGHSAPASVAEPSAAQRFKLLGVIASTHVRADGQPGAVGSALIAADGQAPQALVQGQEVAPGWHVYRVAAAAVQLRHTPTQAILDLALPTAP